MLPEASSLLAPDGVADGEFCACLLQQELGSQCQPFLLWEAPGVGTIRHPGRSYPIGIAQFRIEVHAIAFTRNAMGNAIGAESLLPRPRQRSLERIFPAMDPRPTCISRRSGVRARLP